MAEVTVTVTVQLLEAGIVAPLKDNVLPPAEAVAVPPQVLDTAGVPELSRPAGYVSVKVTPVMLAVFGLLRVIVSVLVALAAIVEGLKVLLTVGAARAKFTVGFVLTVTAAHPPAAVVVAVDRKSVV